MEDGFCPGESIPFAANGQRDNLAFRPPEGKDAQSQSQERSAAAHFWEIISLRFSCDFSIPKERIMSHEFFRSQKFLSSSLYFLSSFLGSGPVGDDDLWHHHIGEFSPFLDIGPKGDDVL